MARPLRIQAAGLSYHVTSRGVRRMPMFRDDDDRRRFLEMLAEVTRKFDVRCHAYCEMTNHYHLAITTMAPNLSEALKKLNGDYAKWWNRRHGHSGHVFEARFGAQIVQDSHYLLNVCRYVVLNPVRAGMVDNPEQWPWSSYRAMAGIGPVPSFLTRETVAALVGGDDLASGAARFRRWVQAFDALTDVPPRDPILGDDEFIARFQPLRNQASREVPLRERRPPLGAIFRGAVTRAKRNAAILVAVRARYRFTEIARYLGVHPATVSRVVSQMGPRGVARARESDLIPEACRKRRSQT